MSIRNIKEIGNVTVVELEGRIDIHTSENIGDEMMTLIDKGKKEILYDLSHLNYLSSSGLRIFVSVRRRLDGLKGRVKICGMNKTIKEIFDIVELTSLYEVFDNSEEAIKSFS